MRRVKLLELAHSRAGDKDNTSNISLIPYRVEDYPLWVQVVTAARVRQWMGGSVQGQVVRYKVPSIAGLNFVLEDALGGGVTRSLAMDAHGKSLSSLLLELGIDCPDPDPRLL